MALIKLTDRTGSFWINPARVNALTTGDGDRTRVWFAAGSDADEGGPQTMGDWFNIDLPLDQVAAIINGDAP